MPGTASLEDYTETDTMGHVGAVQTEANTTRRGKLKHHSVAATLSLRFA